MVKCISFFNGVQREATWELPKWSHNVSAPSLQVLSLETAVMLVLTSAKRVSELPDLQVNPCCLFLRGDNSGVHWLNPSFVFKSTGSSLRSWGIQLVHLSICHWFTNTKYTLWIHTVVFYLSCFQRGQKKSFLYAFYANVSSLMCIKIFLNDSLMKLQYFLHYYVKPASCIDASSSSLFSIRSRLWRSHSTKLTIN